MKPFIQLMKALSDPNRVGVLKMLEQGEICACEIQAVLGLAQPTVSKHMKILEEAGLVQRRRQGTWMLYSLAEEEKSVYVEVMLEHLAAWLNDDPDVERMLAALPDAATMRTLTTKKDNKS